MGCACPPKPGYAARSLLVSSASPRSLSTRHTKAVQQMHGVYLGLQDFRDNPDTVLGSTDGGHGPMLHSCNAEDRITASSAHEDASSRLALLKKLRVVKSRVPLTNDILPHKKQIEKLQRAFFPENPLRQCQVSNSKKRMAAHLPSGTRSNKWNTIAHSAPGKTFAQAQLLQPKLVPHLPMHRPLLTCNESDGTMTERA